MQNVEPLELGPVPTWSYSALKVFEECAHRTYLSKVEKAEEPQSPAAERGNLIHKLAEDYVQGITDNFPLELKHHKNDFQELRSLYADGIVEIEQDWAVDQHWQPTGWSDDDCWGRIKLDAFVLESETSARVIDHKTGKKYAIAHSSQGQQYAIAAFMRHPSL
jgi:RecB family exonuclease